MSNELNIVCFLWYGDRWDRGDEGILYVNKLFRGVQKHLSLPHRFICMTNEKQEYFDDGIETIPLNAPSWRGCLPKVSMFDSTLNLKGQVLSLDIDVVIVGSLNDMASCRKPFIVRSSFRPPYDLDGDIVGFNVGDFNTEQVWLPLKLNPQKVEKITGGRERFWYRHVLNKDMDTWQNIYPGQLLSYKNHLQNGVPLPENARIVSCHGRPRPHQLTEDWAIENWRDL